VKSPINFLVLYLLHVVQHVMAFCTFEYVLKSKLITLSEVLFDF
jgi:hypothetical protein